MEKLLTLIEIAKQNNLTFLKVGDIEFSFGPASPAVAVPVELEPEKEKAPAAATAKRGADGLTAAEQEALYGTVIDAEG